MKLDLFGGHKLRDVIEIDSSSRELEIESESFSFDDAIHVTCRLSRDGDVVRLNCEVSTLVSIQCVRCLDVIQQDIIGEFSLVAKRLRKGESISEYTDEDSLEKESDFIYVEYDVKTIDITEFVHDAVLLAIPLKPVCRESCKGLCYVCGHDLNEGECGCKRERIDPRWQKLSELFNS